MTTISSYLDAIPRERGGALTRTERWRRTITLAVSLDAVMLLLAVLLSYRIRELAWFTSHDSPIPEAWWTVPAIAVLWLLALRQTGAYSIRHMRAGVTEYKRVVSASLVVAGVVGVTCYLTAYEFARVFFVSYFLIGLSGLVLVRFVRRRVMHRLHLHGLLLTPVIVAGRTGHVDSVAKVLRREKWLGYDVVGAITRKGERTTPTGLPVLGHVSDIAGVLARHDVAAVIFAEGSFASPSDFRRMAWDLEARDVQMIVVPNVADISAQRLDVRPVAGLPLVDVERPQAIAATRWIKRSFDLAVSALLLVLAAPVLAGVALAIWLEDRGPVLFRQVRVGRGGEEFNCLKFRSMCVDAEARLAELQARNQGAGLLFKIADDPRITRVGRFIRRYSLDELPQLWNAFRGDMSLVGPRPALPREVAQYDSDTRRRLDVRPGLTGLWQVSGRSNLSWEDTVRLDLFYVDNWSMVQDLAILAKTARAVLGSDGAY
jgi:exopolysaccharide biosynthesis polyprenyl glycosylphosphotransferase